jgi:hypothetical protein
LLDAIQTGDAGLNAATANIRTDDGPTGIQKNFESAVAHLLQYGPVAKRRATTAGTKRGAPLERQGFTSDTTLLKSTRSSIMNRRMSYVNGQKNS